jgi:hypothetical protein
VNVRRAFPKRFGKARFRVERRAGEKFLRKKCGKSELSQGAGVQVGTRFQKILRAKRSGRMPRGSFAASSSIPHP